MRLRGNAKLRQMSKKVTDFLWIRFIVSTVGMITKHSREVDHDPRDGAAAP